VFPVILGFIYGSAFALYRKMFYTYPKRREGQTYPAVGRTSL